MDKKTEDYCSGCGHKDTCREVYSKLGKYSGPSVAFEAVKAFLIPIVVFIIGFAASQRLLGGSLNDKALIGAGIAAGLSFNIVVFAVLRGLGLLFKKKNCSTR